MQYHEPVMWQEVIELLQPRPGDTMIDCNLGTGGHSLALLEACGGKGFLVGLDLDDDMLSLALKRFRDRSFSSDSYALLQADHSDLARVMGDLGLEYADRIVMDLGASSLHFNDPTRGFSCQMEGPLDMRYDRASGDPAAADIVNGWDERDLADLFKRKGDERWASRIAGRIVEQRKTKPFETTKQLADAVASAIPRKAWPPRIHPATRVFLALRVEVNREDEALEQGLNAALDALSPGGRIAVLTFQSHEDRFVKRLFRSVSRPQIDETDPWGRPKAPVKFNDLTNRPITASPEEINANPRSRSAKLRGLEKKIETD